MPFIMNSVNLFYLLSNIGVALTGGDRSTGNNDVSSSNQIGNYTFFHANGRGLLFRCVTGFGPSGNNNADLGELYFNGQIIPNGGCTGSFVIQARGATISTKVGIMNVLQCRTFTYRQEGVYTCRIMNSSMMYEERSVGVYLPGRSKFFL